MNGRPVRTEGVELVPAADGYVAYDTERERIHYLNHTTALILEFATGENTDEDIISLLAAAYDLSDPPEDVLRECLAQLREQGLVVDVTE